jgi:hypothetical protein
MAGPGRNKNNVNVTVDPNAALQMIETPESLLQRGLERPKSPWKYFVYKDDSYKKIIVKTDHDFELEVSSQNARLQYGQVKTVLVSVEHFQQYAARQGLQIVSRKPYKFIKETKEL